MWRVILTGKDLEVEANTGTNNSHAMCRAMRTHYSQVFFSFLSGLFLYGCRPGMQKLPVVCVAVAPRSSPRLARDGAIV